MEEQLETLSTEMDKHEPIIDEGDGNDDLDQFIRFRTPKKTESGMTIE